MAIVSYARVFSCGYVDVHERYCHRRALRHPSGEAKCFGHWVVGELMRMRAPRLVGGLAAALAFYDAIGALANLFALAFPALAGYALTTQPSMWRAVGLTAAAATLVCVARCLRSERATAGRLFPVAGLWLVGVDIAIGAMLASGHSLPGYLDGAAGLSRYQGFYILAGAVGLLGYLLGILAMARPLRILTWPVPLLFVAALVGVSVSAIMLFARSNGVHWGYLAWTAVILVVFLSQFGGLRRWVHRLSEATKV